MTTRRFFEISSLPWRHFNRLRCHNRAICEAISSRNVKMGIIGNIGDNGTYSHNFEMESD